MMIAGVFLLVRAERSEVFAAVKIRIVFFWGKSDPFSRFYGHS
jgi:hypothetical protein